MRFAALLFCILRLAYAAERFQTYTTDNGLPSDGVLAMRQTHDGYIWFTTSRGIVRFDGLRFQIFNPGNTPAIHGTNFAAFSLMEDSRGTLWGGTWNAGAICYQNGIFRAYTVKDGLPNNSVIRIDEDAQGTIWLYTAPGLSRIRNGKVEVVKTIDGEPVDKYSLPPPSIGPDANLWGLWRIGNTSIERFAYGKWSTVPLPEGVNPRTVKLDWTIEDSRRRLHFAILGRPRQSFQVFNGKLKTTSGLPPGAFVNYEDRFGRLWLTDTTGHVATWKAGQARLLDGVPASSLFRVMEDDIGGFWVGTRSGGLAHGTEQAITNITLPDGPDANLIGPVTQDVAGNIWAGSYGLTRITADGHTERFFQKKPGTEWRTAQEIFSLWAEADGTLICGYETGVKLFRYGRFFDPPVPLDQIRTQVSAILRDSEGTLWLGSGEGLFSVRQGRLDFLERDKTALHGQVRALYEDARKTLWIGTDEGICRYRNNSLSCMKSPDELTQWRVLSITSDASNVIWAGTSDRGLLRIENENLRWIGEADGLPSNDGAAILPDKQGNFWIGSQFGIYRVSRQSLNDLAHGLTSRVGGTLFNKTDGLEGSNCKGNGQPHGFVAADGSLWFPTSSGVAFINPDTVRSNPSPPKLSIESCSLDQHPLPCSDEVTLPPDGKNLEIHYTALSLLRADQTRFKYRLSDFDPDWLYTGSRNVAYYSHLDPGTYHFQVTAANSDGVWNANPRELRIVVRAHFYQSLHFRLLLVCVAAAAFWGAWRLRTLQFQRHQARQRAFSRQVIASQETERKRIAGELHDALGQRLSLISNLALLAERSTNGNRGQEFRAIAAEASQAATDVRQISRNLRPVQLDLLGLNPSLENLARTMCQSAGLEADISIDDLTGLLPKDLEIHLYRVLQECLNNIVKHAHATRVSVHLRRQGRKSSLVVADNGLGFSTDGRDGHSKADQFGLIGILERSELLGGKALIRSSAGQGTTVTVEINGTL